MTKLTRVEEEEPDRDNPFRPGSQLDREADSILRGSHISRNSIQLAGGVDSKETVDISAIEASVGDSLLSDFFQTPIAVGAQNPPQEEQQQPRRNSKGHVRINEDTVYIVSPDTEVTTTVIADDGEDDEEEEETQFKQSRSNGTSSEATNGHSSPVQATPPSSSSNGCRDAADCSMIEVQVKAATLNAASPSIAETISLADAKKTQRRLSAKQQQRGGVVADKACCSVM